MAIGDSRRASARDLAALGAGGRDRGDSQPGEVSARETPSRGAPSLYGCALAELRKQRFFGFGAVASALGVGIGHAGLALSAGLVARSLVSESGSVRGVGLSTVCLIGLLASLLKAIAQAGLAHSQARLSAAVGNRVRSEVARGLLAQGGTGTAQQLLARIAVRVREVELGSEGWIALHRAIAQLVPLAAALIFLSPPMAIAAVGVLTPFGLLVARFRGQWKREAHQAQSDGERLHAHVDELVGNLDLFRSFGAGTQVLTALDTAARDAGERNARVEAFRVGLSGANEVLGALAVLGTVLLAQRLGLGLGDGLLLAFAAVFFMAYRPLRDLGDGRSAWVKGQAALESLDALTGKRVPDQDAFSWGNGLLVCERLGHAERGPALDIRLGFGEVLWLRGPNGSGKTTLLRCLLGLESTRGQAVYAGRKLDGAGVGPGARPFAWVPQAAPIITGTLLDNVRLMGAGEAQANAALELLDAAWLNGRLADDVLGPGGREVSGGERRLIALARAVATQQPVLLLDEPLAGLDETAARKLLLALRRLRGERSLIVVSHEALPQGLADHQVLLTPEP